MSTPPKVQEGSIDATKVRCLRLAMGMSRAQLAVAAGLSYAVIVKVEQGESCSPAASTLAGLARALEVPMEELLA